MSDNLQFLLARDFRARRAPLEHQQLEAVTKPSARADQPEDRGFLKIPQNLHLAILPAKWHGFA